MEGLKSRAAALIVCAAVALAGWFGGMSLLQNQTESLTLQAGGMKPNTVVMTVAGSDITAEAYLYWVTACCDEFYQYYGISDFTMALTADMTAADYVKQQADYYALQYVAIEQLAGEYGISLSEEQKAELEAMEEYYMAYYGGEEIYNYMMLYSGLTEELLSEINEIPYLYALMCEQFMSEGGMLEPSAENLQTYAQKHHYTELSEEELLAQYVHTESGAMYDFVNEYIDRMDVTKHAKYDAIDVAQFYPALLEVRMALPVPEITGDMTE